MSSAFQKRPGLLQHAFSERAAALLLVLLTGLGAVSTPLCLRARPQAATAMVAAHTAGHPSAMEKAEMCDDPCCRHSSPQPAPHENRACAQHCWTALPATAEDLASPAPIGMVAPGRVCLQEPMAAAIAVHAVALQRTPVPPPLLTVPLRI